MIHLATNDYKRGALIYSHAETQAARGELHFNELLILVRASDNNIPDEYLCPLFEVEQQTGNSRMWFHRETANIYHTHTPFSLSETYITV